MRTSTTIAHSARFLWLLGLAFGLVDTGCNPMTDFDRPLVLPDFRDATEEIVIACEEDADCSALGPCVICTDLVCIEADEADQDEDGWFNADCRGEVKGDDCDDLDRTVHPEADERCNGADDDCNGIVDEGEAFGLGWVASAPGGRTPSSAPVPGRTGLAWVEGSAPCPSVMSAFVGQDGIVRFPAVLSSCGEDPWIASRGATDGFAAAWVDRTEGGADIMLRLLDTLGQPVPYQPEPINISDDFEESDMPALAWAGSAFLFGAAWLSHDTDDRNLLSVRFDSLDPSGEPLLSVAETLSLARFTLNGGIEPGFGERIDIETIVDPLFEGFAIAWVQDSGTWIAFIDLSEDGTTVEAQATMNLSDQFDAAGAMLPDIAWAGDRLAVAYARVDPLSGKPSPDILLAQISISSWPALVASQIDWDVEFPREATYPAIGWHEDLEEIGIAWADGREGYGLREVRFARLKLQDDGASTVAQPVMDELILTDPDAYAGGVGLGIEPGGGFVVTWTERSGDDVGLMVGYLECRQ